MVQNPAPEPMEKSFTLLSQVSISDAKPENLQFSTLGPVFVSQITYYYIVINPISHADRLALRTMGTLGFTAIH